MIDLEPTDVTNLDRYGSPPLPWNRPRELLEAGPVGTCFLGTTRPDARPHSAPIGAIWHDGFIYFTSSFGTRKSRNLAESPACTISVALDGIDLVLEGEAATISDQAILEEIAGKYREVGWPAEVDGDALTAPYSAPSAGPPPWHVYRFTFHTAFGVATAEPHGATRWRFRR